MKTIKVLSSLKGRRALITGAAGFLGAELANTLAELGADLILVDRQSSALQKLKGHLEGRWGVDVQCHVCDLESEAERNALITHVSSNQASLNILVNNAAFVGANDMSGWTVPFELQTLDTWRRAIEVNLTAVFHLCQGLTPMLRNAEGASIVNIASIYGIYGPDWRLYEETNMGNPAAYGASKGGLIQFTKWLSTTLAPNVRVNAISPGGILRGQDEVFIARYQSKTPLGRMASEEDFCGAIAYLATDLSRYVTGQNLVIDGGWGVW